MNKGIYIHIPFCVSKCGYCTFNSSCRSEETIKMYFNSLKEEILQKRRMFSAPDTIYIGGGTPSFPNQKYIEEVTDALKIVYDFSDLKEFTIEMNPESVSREKYESYKKNNINRFSMGIQSMDEKCLNILGRRHSLENLKRAFDVLKNENNLSVDLIWGVKGFTTDLSVLDNYEIKHVSLYLLTVEDGSVIKKNGYIEEDDSAIYDEYIKILNGIRKRGYKRYEVSNFAKEGFESIHNMGYWNTENVYEGYGLSASSYDLKARYKNTDLIDEYINNPMENVETDTLDDDKRFYEEVFLGLRKTDGLIVRKEIHGRLNHFEIDEFVKSGHLIRENETVKATDEGFLILNLIVEKIIR